MIILFIPIQLVIVIVEIYLFGKNQDFAMIIKVSAKMIIPNYI